MNMNANIPVDLWGRLQALAERHGRSVSEELTALVEAKEAADAVHERWAGYAAKVAHLSLEERAARKLQIEQRLLEATERRARAGDR